MNSGRKYQIDMSHGPLFGKIVLFSIPLMTANVMQVLFNAIDLIVVGRFGSSEAMAAIGSCGSLCSMYLCIFFGLSVGANVLAARFIGARDHRQVFQTVHTAVATALYGGIVLALVAAAVSRPILVVMKTPENILPKSTLYILLYCVGIPFILLYNFGSSILRAAGDTRRPLVYMIFSGCIKTGLNLFMVCVLGFDVAGVAVATLVSNMISSYLVLHALSAMRTEIRLFMKNLKFYASNFREMVKIGLPAGVQGALFAISNMTIQSTINSFGDKAMAGSAATSSLEGIVYVAFISYYFAVISFVGQNLGAKKYKRIVRSIFYCLLLTTLAAIAVGWSIFFFGGEKLLRIYNKDPEVIEWAMIRLHYLVTTYFLCAIMEVLAGALRGLGHSLAPMIVTMLGACVFRVAWVIWIFPLDHTMNNLLLSYPVSWILVSSVNGLLLYIVCRKLFRSVTHRNGGKFARIKTA